MKSGLIVQGQMCDRTQFQFLCCSMPTDVDEFGILYIYPEKTLPCGYVFVNRKRVFCAYFILYKRLVGSMKKHFVVLTRVCIHKHCTWLIR